MPKPIQAYPPGFMSLLSLKNMGKLPDTLLENVQATFDLESWYLRGANQVLNPLISGVATGGLQSQAVLGPVPEGELWFVQHFAIKVFTAAPPASLDWWTELQIFDRDGHIRGGRTDPVVQSVAGGGSLVASLNGFWLYAGERLGALWVLAAGDTFEVAAISGAKVLF